MTFAQSPKHQDLIAKAQQYFPGASNGNAALSSERGFVIASGQGARVYDPDGHAWIDYLLGSGPMILDTGVWRSGDAGACPEARHDRGVP